MRDQMQELFRTALGLAKPWVVSKIEFSDEQHQLDLWLDFPAGSQFACPECGRADCGVYDTTERTWRHLNFFQHKTFLHARQPRIKCLDHGVKTVTVPACHVEQSRCFLQDFVDRVGHDKRLGGLGELDLEDYRNQTLRLPISAKTGRSISPRTANGRLKAVKVLFCWAYRMFLIERLPRNIDSISKVPKNGNGSQQPKVKTFTVEELQGMWAKATSRTRCYIALALNCGMGQKDVSDLRNNEVDWENGYIERGRSKTNIQAKHKLWAVSLALLKQHRCSEGDDDLVLLGRNGLPLVRSKIVDMRMTHSDAVTNTFVRLMKKQGLQNTGRGFYSLRRTGASCIEKIDPLATEMYLAHVEQGMKRTYAQRDWARLDRALVEMEKAFSLKQ